MIAWTIISTFVTIASLVFAISVERKRRRERDHRQQRFEWSHIHQGVRQICRWLRRGGFAPDILIGVPGAGVILSELAIIEWDEALPLYMVQQKTAASSDPWPGASGKEFQTAKWRYWIPSSILSQVSKRVLILDDYAQSGDTLRELKKTLVMNGFAEGNVRTAALIGTRSLWETDKAPDYVWFKIDTYDAHMPWGHASKKIRTGEMDQAQQ